MFDKLQMIMMMKTTVLNNRILPLSNEIMKITCSSGILIWEEIMIKSEISFEQFLLLLRKRLLAISAAP